MSVASQNSTDQHGSLQFSLKFQNYFRMFYKVKTEALTPEMDCHQRKDTIFLSKKKPDSHRKRGLDLIFFRTTDSNSFDALPLQML